MQYHHHDIAQYLLFVIFRSKSGNDQYDKLYNDLLSNYLASDIDDSFKGRLFYNLANSVRDVNAYESFSYYMKAVKYEHTYKNLYYWWQEVAGVFYITKHFKIAEQFYKKARMLSPEKCRNDIEILISDCLICQGRIDDALEEELLYVGKRKIITGAINLKMLITKIIAKQQINVFDPVYWFNQGIEACNNNKFSESLECFLFSWRLYDGDIEALTNAFIQALNADDVAKQLVIIHAIREISPDESYKHLVSTLLSNGVEDIIIDNDINGDKILQNNWWVIFEDEQLNNIISTAVKYNEDSVTQRINVIKALYNAKMSKVDMFPKLSAHSAIDMSKDMHYKGDAIWIIRSGWSVKSFRKRTIRFFLLLKMERRAFMILSLISLVQHSGNYRT